jgi:hypothetical protein
MEQLFPQGEAKKREIMELALTEGFQAPPSSEDADAELTGAQTVTAAVRPPTGSKSRLMSKWVGLAIAVSTLLVVVAVWGSQDLTPEVPPSAEAAPSMMEPTVAPSEVEPAEPPLSDEPASKTPEPEAIELKPEQPKADQPTPAKRRTVAQKTRPRKKPSKPSQPQPAAAGLPGQVKIITKGHSVEIYEGRKLLGKAPALLTLPAGRHKLTLKSTESGESLTLPVNIVANATKTISLDVD